MKTKLEQLTNDFTRFYEEKNRAIQNMKDSGVYSDEHIHRMQSEACNEIQTKKIDIVARCRDVVESAKNSFIKTLSVKPENYDIKLNTTITILNVANDSFNTDELQEWLRPFKYDYKTMLLFNKIITGEKKAVVMIYERIPKIIELFDKVYEGMDTYISEPVQPGFNLGGALSLMFAVDGIESKTDDLLTTVKAW